MTRVTLVKMIKLNMKDKVIELQANG